MIYLISFKHQKAMVANVINNAAAHTMGTTMGTRLNWFCTWTLEDGKGITSLPLHLTDFNALSTRALGVSKAGTNPALRACIDQRGTFAGNRFGNQKTG